MVARNCVGTRCLSGKISLSVFGKPPAGEMFVTGRHLPMGWPNAVDRRQTNIRKSVFSLFEVPQKLEANCLKRSIDSPAAVVRMDGFYFLVDSKEQITNECVFLEA